MFFNSIVPLQIIEMLWGICCYAAASKYRRQVTNYTAWSTICNIVLECFLYECFVERENVSFFCFYLHRATVQYSFLFFLYIFLASAIAHSSEIEKTTK